MFVRIPLVSVICLAIFVFICSFVVIRFKKNVWVARLNPFTFRFVRLPVLYVQQVAC